MDESLEASPKSDDSDPTEPSGGFGDFPVGRRDPPDRVSQVLRTAMHQAVAAAVKGVIDDLMSRGVIKPSRFDDPSVSAAMAGMVDEAERGVPDPLRVDLLRRAFRAVLIGDEKADPEGTADEDMFEIARRLTPVQAAVLDSLYKHHTAIKADCDALVTMDWRGIALQASGLPHSLLLDGILDQLRQLGLVAAGLWDGEGWGPLTPAGVAFCRFVGRVE